MMNTPMVHAAEVIAAYGGSAEGAHAIRRCAQGNGRDVTTLSIGGRELDRNDLPWVNLKSQDLFGRRSKTS
jgi:hypothetical protein